MSDTTIKAGLLCPKCGSYVFRVMADNDDNSISSIGCHKCEYERNIEPPRTLTINQSMLLGQIHHGVERGLKLRYYQFGTRDADHPLIVSMRAFTYEGGNLYAHDADVRDAYVWTSGFTERWFKVDELITALDNMQGTHGLDNPMAVIEEE